MAENFTERCISTSDWAMKRPNQSYHFIALIHTFLLFSGDAAYFAKKNGIDSDAHSFELAPRGAAETLAYAAMLVEGEAMRRP